MVRKFIVAAAALAFSAPLFAACEVTIEGNDQMKFNMANIDVSKSCKEFTVTLKHVGKMPKTAMGHNWVLSKTADMKPIADEGAKLKDKDYIKSDDARIIAHTKLIGGGETDKVTFPISKLNATDSYSFFCTFPGHSALMKGTLKLVN